MREGADGGDSGELGGRRDSIKHKSGATALSEERPVAPHVRLQIPKMRRVIVCHSLRVRATCRWLVCAGNSFAWQIEVERRSYTGSGAPRIDANFERIKLKRA